jgi:hypothetical protein
VEVRENGGSFASLAGMSWDVRVDGEKPLLHLWSEQFNLTRRVLAITDHSEHRLALAWRVSAGTRRTGSNFSTEEAALQSFPESSRKKNI